MEGSKPSLEAGITYSILGFNEWIVHGNDLHVAMLDPVADDLGSVFRNRVIRYEAVLSIRMVGGGHTRVAEDLNTV